MIFTAYDARNEKRNADARRFAKSDDAAKRAKRDAEVLAANPEIGKLIRKGRPVYYVVRGGKAIEHKDPAALVDGGAA